MNAKVDAFFAQPDKWRAEYEALRRIVLEFPLTEELKWGWPCYSFGATAVVLMHGFKDYCALLFFEGALLGDPHRILVQQTQNVQARRQIRFAGVGAIAALGGPIRSVLADAVAAAKDGRKTRLKETKDFVVAEEFRDALARAPALKAAFDSLTPGRQRAYLLHFSGAKQTRVRVARIEKCAPGILAGKGLDD